MPYHDRIVDHELRKRLESAGAVVIEGPKACGKTVTARQVAASAVMLDVDDNARRAIDVDPALVLAGPTPRLIDEWQVEPAIWNHVRRAVDNRGGPGQFILTGSATPADDITRHTGAGRFARLRMRPMSLYETGHSNGAVSLRHLLDGGVSRGRDAGLTFRDVVDRIVVGGWPALLNLDVGAAIAANRDYLEEIRRVDITTVDGVDRDPGRVLRLLRALARNVATPVATATLASDAGGADGAMSPTTARSYLTALERLMIIEDLPVWAPHLRSKSFLRQAAKRYFVDPSLAVAALGATPDRLVGDLNLLGCLFESLVVRDLRIYAQALGGQVLHYRDNTGLEVDAIVEAADGRWIAVEVKLGEGAIDDAGASLKRFEERVDTSRSGVPSALVVVVPKGLAYTRADGVSVVPIGTLGP